MRQNRMQGQKKNAAQLYISFKLDPSLISSDPYLTLKATPPAPRNHHCPQIIIARNRKSFEKTIHVYKAIFLTTAQL